TPAGSTSGTGTPAGSRGSRRTSCSTTGSSAAPEVLSWSSSPRSSPCSCPEAPLVARSPVALAADQAERVAHRVQVDPEAALGRGLVLVHPGPGSEDARLGGVDV